jgi:hypothetical protein
LWAGLAPPPYLGKWYTTIEHKVLWFKGIERTLQIRAQHLDGPSPPATITIPTSRSAYPYQVSILIFPTPGCWEIAGESGSQRIRFVIRVLPVDQKPRWIP